MSKRLKTTLTLLVSILLAIALIAYSLSGIDFDQTMDSLRQANYFWIGVSVVLGIMAYWFRSQRWQLLLEPMGYQVTAKRSFIAVCMNYFWNLLIPRSGEIARCTSLYALDKTPVDKSFGTVISERVIDMLCLMFIALMAVVTNIDLIKRLMSEVLITRDKAGDTGSSLKLYIFGGTLTLIIILLYAFRNRIKKLSFYPKIREFIYGIQQGLKTIFQLKRKKEFIVYTLLIWIFYFFMTYVVVFALPETEHLGIADGFYLLLVGGHRHGNSC